MRYGELSETRKRQIRYGALAIAVLLLAAGVIIFSHSNPRTTATPDQAQSGRAAQAPPSVQGNVPDDLTPAVSSLRRDEAVNLIGEARRHAAVGNFAEAEASLQKAQKAADLPEIQEAWREIEHLRTPEGSLAQQLRRARLAIEHDDAPAAEAALADASRIKPDAPEVAALRAALQQAQEKAARRETRIAQALARMREAVARRDFAAADSALNEAERIDVQNPSLRRARGELARARGAHANGGQ